MIELRFLAACDVWAEGLCHDCSAFVRLLGVRPVKSSQEVAHFVDIASATDNAAALKKRLRNSDSVVDLDLAELSPNHLMGSVTSSNCRVCNSLIEAEAVCFISSASTDVDCRMGYRLFLSRNGVPRLLEKLSRSGVGYKLAEITPVTLDSRLTMRQLTVLKSAMDLGLYDYPRRITQDELAARLGIKSGTLNEILRRAERNVLGGYLRGA